MLLLQAIAVTGCTGIGLGEGGGRGALPPAIPEVVEVDPRSRALVSGRIELSPLARRTYLRESPASLEGYELSDVSIVLEGRGFERTARLDGAGGFALEPVDPGPCTVTVRLGRMLLAESNLPLRKRMRARLTLHVLGPDLPDLDQDGDREEPLVEVAWQEATSGHELTRTLLPGGLVEIDHPDGSKELGAIGEGVPEGTRVLGPGPLRRFRGPIEQRPLLTAARLEGVPSSGEEVPALVRLVAEVDLRGQEESPSVSAWLHAPGAPPVEVPLLDDGSRSDAYPFLPGEQPSGDRAAEDGIFTLLAGVDKVRRRLLYNGLVVFRARDGRGRISRPRVLVPGWPQVRARAVSGAPLAHSIRRVELIPDAGPAVRAEAGLGSAAPGDLGGVLVAPGERVRVLDTVQGRRRRSSPLPYTAPGLYLVIFSSNAQQEAYYVGALLQEFPSQRQNLIPPPTSKEDVTHTGDTPDRRGG